MLGLLSQIGLASANPFSTERNSADEKNKSSWLSWMVTAGLIAGGLYLLNQRGLLKYQGKDFGTHIRERASQIFEEKDILASIKDYSSLKFAEIKEKGIRAAATEYGNSAKEFGLQQFSKLQGYPPK